MCNWMAFQKGYYYKNGKLVPSKAARKQKKRDSEIRKISDVWHASKHLYDYDNPPLNKYTAEQRGWDIYWGICKYGHIGERSVKHSSCKTCEKINRSIRNARTRGALAVALSRAEKDRIAALYEKAQSLSVSTGKPHHVDHIRPLAAGGLHHPDNLRVISAEENLAKGSTFEGKRRKYSRQEKKEARDRFKEGHDRFGRDKKYPTAEIISNIIIGIIAGGLLGPLAFITAHFSPSISSQGRRNAEKRAKAMEMRKYVHWGITASCIGWGIIIFRSFGF